MTYHNPGTMVETIKDKVINKVTFDYIPIKKMGTGGDFMRR
jgi:hypothetical protein